MVNRKVSTNFTAQRQLGSDLFKAYTTDLTTKKNTLAVFIDLEKAFDSVWRDGLLVKLHRFGIRGKLWKWIEGFLNDRKARCHLKGQYGPIFFTTVGLPQGSVISPILFIIFLQDIFKEISANGVKYADDGTIWVTGNDI